MTTADAAAPAKADNRRRGRSGGGSSQNPRPVRVFLFFALACVWTAFIAFLTFMAFKEQLSLSKVMTLEQRQLRSLR